MFEALMLLSAIAFGQIDGMYMLGHSILTGLNGSEDMAPSISSNADEELHQDSYFSSHYFSNLTDNFGSNIHGSCSFVAAAMLLTYFDTYWDDNIVDDSYIAYSITPGPKTDDFIGIESPGAIPDPKYVGSGSIEDYKSFVESNAYRSLHFYLMSLGSDMYPDVPNKNYGFAVSRTEELIAKYLVDIRGYSKRDFTLEYTKREVNAQIKDWVIDRVKEGIPVFAAIDIPTGYHAAIAYDYDDEAGELYFHTGWHGDLGYLHTSYSDFKVIQIQEAFTLDFESAHVHSGNYRFQDQGYLNDYCICYSVVPWDLVIDNYYLDQLPTLVWKALVGKWYEDLTYRISFLDARGHEQFGIGGVSGLSIDLTETDYLKAISIPGNFYQIYISLERDGDPFLDDDYYLEQAYKPYRYKNLVQVFPDDWGFEARYWFASEGIRDTTLRAAELTISTERLRCGYIEDKYIVLSPKRQNAGEAYLELIFDSQVYSLVYSALWWSGSEDAESASIAVRDNAGRWQTAVDLMNDVDLPEGGSFPCRQLLYYPDGITGVRFEATADASGTRNKGRLCIDDLAFSTSPEKLSFFYGDYWSTYKYNNV